MKIVFFIFVILLSYSYSYSQISITVSESDQKGTATIGESCGIVTPIALPDYKIEPKELKPVFLSDLNTKNKSDFTQEVLRSINAYSILFNKEFSSFKINTANQTIEHIGPTYTLSQQAKDAIEQAPIWVRGQLELKLRILAKTGYDDDYAQLILDAPENQKDEVAFLVAYLSYQSLTSSRLVPEKQMLLQTADFIYKVDDSLQYVDLVEYGSYANRDYYTTTKYRVYDPALHDTVWFELPKELYYFYIVHPKLDQEGVYVKDNSDDNSGQRTYGYAWRDFIWNNPDPAHNYTNVNKTTTKGSVITIPRFGELMKKPRILWDRVKTYMTFNRPFEDNDHAMDVIGNWCSKAVPVDVTLPRAFQPNQILMKHDGNCNEDAFLVAAACRTALIPLVYLGSWSQDHVFGSFWDRTWNHFEFFRGGLAPSGNEFYGITNMLDRGSYGWENAIVEGYRPDGYIESFTRYYADTCNFKVSVTDSIGNPIEGAMLVLYAAPSAYSSNPAQCGTVWTDFNGRADIPGGVDKTYLIQAYHPSYGWSPQDSIRAYYLLQTPAVANLTYNRTVPFPNVKLTANPPNSVNTPNTGKFGVHARWNVQDILTGVNSRDSQRSRFYKWNEQNKGEITFFICDSTNYEKFVEGEEYTAYDYTELAYGGDITKAFPSEGLWYCVFSNHNFTNYYQYIDADIELLSDVQVDVKEPVNISSFTIQPQPASDFITITNIGMKSKLIKIYNLLGNTVWQGIMNEESMRIDISSFPIGVYFVNVGKEVKMFIKN